MKIKFSYNELVFWLVAIFPLSTVLHTLPGFESLNSIINIIIIVILLRSCFGTDMSTENLVMLLIGIFISAISVILAKNQTNFGTNVLAYYPMWVLYFFYLKNEYTNIVELAYKNAKFLIAIVIIWDIVIIVSLFVPSAYVVEEGIRYFAAFSGGEHRMASSCILIMAYSFMIAYMKNKKYFFLSMVPLFAILYCGARTYLIIALLFMVAIYYTFFQNKKHFWLSLIPILVIFTIIIFMLPAGQRLVESFTKESSAGQAAAVTSGRTIFWAVDLEAYSELSFIKKLVGNGAFYIFEVNYANFYRMLWAHNDFINILLSQGAIGVCIYIYAIFSFLIDHVFKKTSDWVLISSIVGIWLVNAFLNMVYTYPCAYFAVPYIVCSLITVPNNKKQEGKE